METFKQPWVTYLGAVIALFAVIAGAMNWVDPQIVWGVAGIFGFGSIASLRAYIESKGWKTYFAAGIPMIAGLLVLAKIITLDQYRVIVGAFAPITAATLQQAKVKETKVKNETKATS